MINAIQLGQQAWKTWRETSVNTRIFAAMLTVGGLTVLVKMVSAGKELVIAYQFGTSDALDAFVMAFLLPQFVIELIGGALKRPSSPPTFRCVNKKGSEAAQRLIFQRHVLEHRVDRRRVGPAHDSWRPISFPCSHPGFSAE